MGVAFFGLAYWELFTAGANVPGGPFSGLTGAMNIVWNPQWLVIVIYAWHCLLASVLMTLNLLKIDKQISSMKFFTLLAAVFVGWWVLPYLLVR